MFHLEKDDAGRLLRDCMYLYVLGPNVNGHNQMYCIWEREHMHGPNTACGCRFKRCFIGIGTMLNITYGCGMRFCVVYVVFSTYDV